MSPTRPYMQFGVAQLEELFEKSKSDSDVLKQLAHELQHRQVPRAVTLLEKVRAQMNGAKDLFSLAPGVKVDQKPSGNAPKPRAYAVPSIEKPDNETNVRTSLGGAPLVTTVQSKPAQAPIPIMTVEEAYRALKVALGATWESIEQSRRLLVQKASPTQPVALSSAQREQALTQARRVNAAYETLWRSRMIS